MPIDIDSVLVDVERETKGDWIDFPDWSVVNTATGEVEMPAFKVSSLHLPGYRVDRDLMGQRFARQFKGKPVPSDVLTAAVGELFIKHILHDWRNFKQPFSKEYAQKIFASPQGRNLIAAVEWCAAKVSDVEAEFVEDAAKNSERPSGTD